MVKERMISELPPSLLRPEAYHHKQPLQERRPKNLWESKVRAYVMRPYPLAIRLYATVKIDKPLSFRLYNNQRND